MFLQNFLNIYIFYKALKVVFLVQGLTAAGQASSAAEEDKEKPDEKRENRPMGRQRQSY